MRRAGVALPFVVRDGRLSPYCRNARIRHPSGSTGEADIRPTAVAGTGVQGYDARRNRRTSMSDHVIYVDRFQLRDGKLEDFRKYATEMAEFVEENEPGALSFN